MQIGTTRKDGKVWSGENYGYQTQATHNKLKKAGKFKVGAQGLDRLTQTLFDAPVRIICFRVRTLSAITLFVAFAIGSPIRAMHQRLQPPRHRSEIRRCR